MRWEYDDGGRADAGFRGDAGDCVTRAIAIAFQLDYRQIYDELGQRQKLWAVTSRSRAAKRARMRSRALSARNGAWKDVYGPLIEQLGGVWTPTMQIGEGCRVHLRDGEIPSDGRIIVRLSKHLSAVVDGVVRDTYDPTRDGTRCVYGYWTIEG